MCGSFAKGLEPPIGPTASHLVPDRWIRFSTTQQWSGNRLSSSSESSSSQHARRNGNVHHRTSRTTMMMMILVTPTRLSNRNPTICRELLVYMWLFIV